MKPQFKHQKFQDDAAKTVCDMFAGQPFLTPSYMFDSGYEKDVLDWEFTGFGNTRIVPQLNEGIILE